MPVILKENLISQEDLEKNAIFTMEEGRAASQEIRPIRIAIVNLMPKKKETELQFLRMLSNTALQIKVDFIRMETYSPKNTDPKYLEEFYKTYSEIKDEKYDAMIITGAPLEGLDFEEIKYWKELEDIFEFARTNVHSTMFVCWAAQAALYYYYGLEKVNLDEKIFGIYPQEKQVDDRLLDGFDDEYYIPQSRYSYIEEGRLDAYEDIKVLASRGDIGVSLAKTQDERFIFSLGHWEYDDETIHKEYLRDKKAGLSTRPAYNYYRNDDPEDRILVRWRSAANLFFSNWLNYSVYQETPYDIEEIETRKVSKFGGSSLADAGQFSRVRDIIYSSTDRRLVVVSAPGRRHDGDSKVTDVLIDIDASKDREKDLEELIRRLEGDLEETRAGLEIDFELFRKRFENIVEELDLESEVEEELQADIEGVIEEIKLSDSRDFILSRGEFLNAKIMSHYLDYRFVDAKDLIFFDGYGKLDEEKTYESIRSLIEKEDQVVVPGFYGSDAEGGIKTFERGGSDITGSLLAGALNSKLYENWTDVDGVMTADPRLDKTAKTIPNLSYEELLEIGLAGAGVYQVDAIRPLMDKNIPIEILNTNQPGNTGTRIGKKEMMRMVKKINIGLLGYGTVGSGVDKILRENKAYLADKIHKQTGQVVDLVVKRVLVRDLASYKEVLDDRFTDKLEDILADEDIDIVCELIGGEDFARDLILESFKLGKHVVSANKMAIFKSQGLLEEEAVKAGVYFNYEASVAGVVPVIRAIEESLISDKILEVSGILNGSTNYILTQIEEGRDYEDVVAEAKEEGYLEADPSSDLKGEDPLYKLGILAYLATGVYPSEEDIYLEGIEDIGLEDLEKAKEKGATIKLLGSFKRDGENLTYRVAPEWVYKDSDFYSVRNTTNAVLLKCENSGEVFFKGRGAGSLETATAVIGDIVSIAKKYRRYIMKTRLGIVGATGLVGQTIIGMLEDEDVEFEAVRFFASKDAVGEIIHFKGVDYGVEELFEEDFKDLDYAMFAIDDSISEYYAPMALKHKVRVIDNSNAFRMDEDVPLVVPEVNFHHIKDEHMIIANPNCTTIQSVVALEPIIEKYGAKRIIYSTYQAVSGSGVAGIEDLERGYRGEAPLNYPVEIVGNVIPQIDSFVEDGDTKEEKKMIEETKKILGRYDIGVTATNVRVPVKNGHSVAINIETEKDFDIEEVRRSYIDFEGITYTDYEDKMKYATPKDADGRDDVLVSRIRKDPSIDRGINLWSVGDNLRKGAAGNAVQILLGLINS